VLQRAMQTRGKEIELVQRTKAESDPAVAAASILAREGFVGWLKSQSQKFGMEIPKGVSEGVKQTAINLVEQQGSDVLPKLCKMHFRTSSEVLSRIVSDHPK